MVKERDTYLEIIEYLKEENAIKDSVIEEIEAENINMRKQLTFYNNPDSPSSVNNIPTQQKKARVKRNNKASSKKRGRKKNHKGVSHRNKSDRTIRYQNQTCENCDSNNITTKKLTQKQTIVTEVKTEVVTEVSFEHHCDDCGHTSNTNDQFEGMSGSMLDKKLTAMAIVQRRRGSSINTITKSLKCIDNRISKSMINKAINSAADKLAFLADKIRERNKKSSHIMMDETCLQIDTKRGWVWVLIGDFGVQITVRPSRGKRFAEDIFGFYQGIPLVCDGCPVYNIFETIQRCWSHVLRHGEAAMCDKETRRLYRKLQKLFVRAKKIQAKDQSQVTPELRQQVQKMNPRDARSCTRVPQTE